MDMSNKEKIGFGYIEVVPDKIDETWPKIWPYIEKVVKLSHGEITEESTKQRIKDGIQRCFVILQEGEILAVITLELRIFDSGKRVLYVPIIGGRKMAAWGDEFYNVVEQAAKHLECEEIRGIAVRDGWLPIMKKKGWKEVQTIIYKEVK